MAASVTYPAPTTVNTTCVTYWMEPVLSVSPDGLGQFVTQVSYLLHINCLRNIKANIYIDHIYKLYFCWQSAPGVCTVKTVRNSVWGTVWIMLSVIMWLVSVIEDVQMDGTDIIVNKDALDTVSTMLLVTRGLVCVTEAVMPDGVGMHVIKVRCSPRYIN